MGVTMCGRSCGRSIVFSLLLHGVGDPLCHSYGDWTVTPKIVRSLRVYCLARISQTQKVRERDLTTVFRKIQAQTLAVKTWRTVMQNRSIQARPIVRNFKALGC